MDITKKIGTIVSRSETLLNDSHRHFRESTSEDARIFHSLKLQITILQFEIASEVEQIIRRRPLDFAIKVALKDVLHKIVEYDRTLRSQHIKKILDFAERRGASFAADAISTVTKRWNPKLRLLESFSTLRNKSTAHYDGNIEAQVSAIEAINVDDAVDVIFAFLSFNHEVTGVLRDIVKPDKTLGAD